MPTQTGTSLTSHWSRREVNFTFQNFFFFFEFSDGVLCKVLADGGPAGK